MAEIKDYTNAIAGVDEMALPELHELYSQMLATAHDISYQAPDELLVETDDEEVLRKVIRPLHDSIKKFHAGLDKPRVEGAGAKPVKKAVPKKAPAKTKKKKTAKADKSSAAEPKESDMSTVAAKKAPAAKKAKKAVAKKGATKAAKANARTPVSRNKWGEKAKIKVLAKENPCRKGTGRFDRVANLMKYDGKLVSEFIAKGGKSGTLAYSAEQEWVKIIG